MREALDRASRDASLDDGVWDDIQRLDEEARREARNALTHRGRLCQLRRREPGGNL